MAVCKPRTGVTNVTTFIILVFVYSVLSNTLSPARQKPLHPPDLIDCTTEIRRVTDIIITQGRPLCDTLNSIQSVCELAVWELLLILVRDSLYAARSLQAD